jgi:nitrite reductase/ring-hydroxylating ferredoxin subunit
LSDHEPSAHPADWRRVAALADIPNGGFKCTEVDGIALLLCHVYGQAYALINHCPHQGQRMDKAAMFEYEIVCPHHNACFDVRNGRPVSGPSVFPLGGYPCQVVAGEVEVDMANPDSTMDRHMRAYLAAQRAAQR